jgi:hypothetical protein
LRFIDLDPQRKTICLKFDNVDVGVVKRSLNIPSKMAEFRLPFGFQAFKKLRLEALYISYLGHIYSVIYVFLNGYHLNLR